MLAPSPSSGFRPHSKEVRTRLQPPPAVRSPTHSVAVTRSCLISFPDWLAMARVLVVPVIMALTRLQDRFDYALGWAAALFTVAAITDFLDGYLARRWHVESVLGAFLDTTADKLLVTGTLLALTSIGRVSIWAALVIMMREFLVMGLRGLVAIGGGIVKPSTWGKIKATAQYGAIALAFMRLPDKWGPLYLDQWAMWIAVIVTTASAWGYFGAFSKVVAANRRPSSS
jgi:CDP-diacylglycerol--glycerol-3-phosphate 3-phosphatidyltransferase